jgi:hypothetical protein
MMAFSKARQDGMATGPGVAFQMENLLPDTQKEKCHYLKPQ